MLVLHLDNVREEEAAPITFMSGPGYEGDYVCTRTDGQVISTYSTHTLTGKSPTGQPEA